MDAVGLRSVFQTISTSYREWSEKEEVSSELFDNASLMSEVRIAMADRNATRTQKNTHYSQGRQRTISECRLLEADVLQKTTLVPVLSAKN